MSWADDHIERLERRIRFNKKTFRVQFAVLIFTIAVCIFDTHTLFYNQNAWNGFAVGMMLVTCFWGLMFTVETFSELCGQRNELKNMENLKKDLRIVEAEERLIESSRRHEQAQKALEEAAKKSAQSYMHYTQAIADLQKTNVVGVVHEEGATGKSNCT